jgi:hypothetical protein
LPVGWLGCGGSRSRKSTTCVAVHKHKPIGKLETQLQFRQKKKKESAMTKKMLTLFLYFVPGLRNLWHREHCRISGGELML